MKKKLLTIMIVDDHPLISEAYKNAFNYISKHNKTMLFQIDIAHNCDTANEKINNYSLDSKNIDIVFLDIGLPPSKERTILSGEDLGLKINKLMPNTKIVISTAYNDNYRIYCLIQNLNPDGFLVKNDITPSVLVNAINIIITDPPYYSNSVIKLLRKEVSHKFFLDSIDRKLLYELSLGTMMKDLPEILLLSLPAIEKRKRHLKQVFDAVSSYDKELLLKAKEKGFI